MGPTNGLKPRAQLVYLLNIAYDSATATNILHLRQPHGLFSCKFCSN